MQPQGTRIRRLRFWLHLGGAYFTRYRYWLITLLISALVLTIIVIKLWPTVSRSNVITIGYAGSYNLETIPTEVLSLATQSLVTVDGQGKPQGALASHWQVTDNGKTYLVFLRDNLRWHDDSPGEAKDITIAIENVTITALNNKTRECKLTTPLSSFPTALDKPVFKSKSFYGTGKFRIVQIYTQNDGIKKIALGPKVKGVPIVDIKFYQTEGQLASALKIGDVKYARVQNDKLFENWPNVDVDKTIDNREVVAIFYNTQDSLLSSQELRQALNYSINRSHFDGTTATGPISPSSWAYSADVKKYEYNTGRAKELLTKSQVKNPKIILSVSPGLMPQANSIKKDWQDLGITVELKEEKSLARDFQALLAVEKIPPDPDQYGLWHSTQVKTNLTKLKDVKIDKLLEDARTTQKEEERKDLYYSFQKDLVDAAPAAFLYYPYVYQITYKNQLPLISQLPK